MQLSNDLKDFLTIEEIKELLKNYNTFRYQTEWEYYKHNEVIEMSFCAGLKMFLDIIKKRNKS